MVTATVKEIPKNPPLSDFPMDVLKWMKFNLYKRQTLLKLAQICKYFQVKNVSLYSPIKTSLFMLGTLISNKGHQEPLSGVCTISAVVLLFERTFISVNCDNSRLTIKIGFKQVEKLNFGCQKISLHDIKILISENNVVASIQPFIKALKYDK